MLFYSALRCPRFSRAGHCIEKVADGRRLFLCNLLGLAVATSFVIMEQLAICRCFMERQPTRLGDKPDGPSMGCDEGAQIEISQGEGARIPNAAAYGLGFLSSLAGSPPKIVGFQSYSVAVNQPLRGVPIREGELWYLSLENSVELVSFSLYINGFTFYPEGREVSISITPFSLVRNCKFQSSYTHMNLAEFKIFKISLFANATSYYFAVRGSDDKTAEDDRSKWVLDISHAMRLVTQSLFPNFMISVTPIRGVADTKSRLMAGYLIHHDDFDSVSTLYCELHPHDSENGDAKLTLYENELCMTPVMDIPITEMSICCEKVGINCSCFCIEDHNFSARTLSERKLWLRAVSNVKVKLQNRAPCPSAKELEYFRGAIEEHIQTAKMTFEKQITCEPLLQRSHRKSFQIVRGGDREPVPYPPPDDILMGGP